MDECEVFRKTGGLSFDSLVRESPSAHSDVHGQKNNSWSSVACTRSDKTDSTGQVGMCLMLVETILT